jgi:hypothetical protein
LLRLLGLLFSFFFFFFVFVFVIVLSLCAHVIDMNDRRQQTTLRQITMSRLLKFDAQKIVQNTFAKVLSARGMRDDGIRIENGGLR